MNQNSYCVDFYIKDPIHKEINFHKEQWIAKFIFGSELKRLLEIKQLGLSYNVFPSATNNRYSHSLGTFQVAQKFVHKFKHQIDIKAKKIFLLSALLHDIGHGPFSHAFEKITKINHEYIGKKIILEPKLSLYHKLIDSGIKPEDITAVYDKTTSYFWIAKLISSNLDVDRIDYLLRDSYYIGTNYSTIDVDFLIERSAIINNDICFSKSTINCIESFLLGRYYMHQDIYGNKHSVVFEWALVNIFNRIQEIVDLFVQKRKKIFFYDLYEWIVLKKPLNLQVYVKLNDSNFLSFLYSLQCLNDEVLNSFINYFFDYNSLLVLNWNHQKLLKFSRLAKKSSYDPKYVIYEIVEFQKEMYLDDKKNAINIFDNKKKVVLFDPSKILHFNKTKTRKALVINRKLLNI